VLQKYRAKGLLVGKNIVDVGGSPLMKKLLLAIALVAMFAARPAMSADLEPAPVYQPLPPIVPVYSWTGCYLGGNVGTGWSTWTYSNPTDNPTRPGERGAILGNDVVAGGQVGCDYQGGAWVFGVQGMGDWTQIKGRFFDSTTGAFDESAQARWFATATGRIGVTMTPQALLMRRAVPPGSTTDTRTYKRVPSVVLVRRDATKWMLPPPLPDSAGLSV
jgi:hypothetical protein